MIRRRPYLSTLMACAAACVLLTGCLFTNKSYVRYSGKEVGDRTLTGVAIGETTKAMLISEIGEPSTMEVRDGTETLRYESKKTVEKKSGLFLIFHNETKEEKVRTVSFEFRDGLLQRYWTE